MSIERTAALDAKNAQLVQEQARARLQADGPIPDVHKANVETYLDYQTRRERGLSAIADSPFHAVVKYRVEDGRRVNRDVRCYVHHDTEETELFTDGIVVVPWTNAHAQVALSYPVDEAAKFTDGNGTHRTLRPIERGLFESVLPELIGEYLPGGPFPIQSLATPSKASSSLPEPAEIAEPTPTVEIAPQSATAPQTPELPLLPEAFSEPAPKARRRSSGPLRSVKLGMTREQVDAFISSPRGYLLIEGAPGTGKTTVALQRIRFLLDLDREQNPDVLTYDETSTIVFVPNAAFRDYVGSLLEAELRVSRSLVETPDEYLKGYLRSTWLDRHNAQASDFEKNSRRARQAYFGLCKTDDLRKLWQQFERQIAERLQKFKETFPNYWFDANFAKREVEAFGKALGTANGKQSEPADDPHDSQLRMDQVFRRSSKAYNATRLALRNAGGEYGEEILNEFDRDLRHWLYWVYDPLDALAAYFLSTHFEGLERVAVGMGDEVAAASQAKRIEDWLAGIARRNAPAPRKSETREPVEAKRRSLLGRINPFRSKGDTLLKKIRAELQAKAAPEQPREFGAPERPWIAWLLRSALPETPSENARFAKMPRCFHNPKATLGGPWHHLVIDEAQDLTVAEAAFLTSLVRQNGALTVAADFRQVVSTGRGLENDDAIGYGSAMRSAAKSAKRGHLFTVNKRQTAQLGAFVRAFHRAAFGADASFRAGEASGKRPVLYVAEESQHAELLPKLAEELLDAAKTVAVIGIDHDEVRLRKVRDHLRTLDPMTFAEYHKGGFPSGLIVASAEEVKGHEFDACLVLGLEDVERSPANHSKNRAYVAVSRAMRTLYLVASEKPMLLNGMGARNFTIGKV